MAYRSDDRSDRWKAIGGVLAVHVVLGAVIITGLNVEIIGRAVERLETFYIALDRPPPEEPPPPRVEADRAPEEAGAPGKTADPTPIVAPEPEIRLPVQSPVATSQVPGTGIASSSGAGTSGTGTGAGGSGSGRGGGGAGAASAPPRLVHHLTRGDYRQLTAGRMRDGRAGVAIRVNANGRVDSCRIHISSGDPRIDTALCPLIRSRLVFQPARDVQGRPLAVDTHYMATWNR